MSDEPREDRSQSEGNYGAAPIGTEGSAAQRPDMQRSRRDDQAGREGDRDARFGPNDLEESLEARRREESGEVF
jgi:hypothetical protein